MKIRFIPLALAALFGFAASASAAPPVWESDFGAVLGGLTGGDDRSEAVSLSFPFPFEGVDYTDVHVGTNGAIQLGPSGGDAGFWLSDQLDAFYDSLHNPVPPFWGPIVAPFVTDLDLDEVGTIHFKDFGDRAVFTWNEVGTYAEELHLLSFQIQLFADGRIYFSYNGILDGVGEDLVLSLGQGILVGVSGSTGAVSNPAPSDLSAPAETDSETLYEVWNHGAPPANDLFDLDQQTLVFVPKSSGGFRSYLFGQVPTLTTKASPDLLIGKTANSLRGDGLRNPRRPSAKQTITHSRPIFTTNTATAVLVMQNDGSTAASFRLRSSGDRFPRMTVSAKLVGGGNVSAALRSGRFSRTLAGDGSVRVIYRLRTDQYYAGILRGGDRDDTVRFRLSGAGAADNAAMTIRYR